MEEWTARALSAETWDDFEAFFGRYHGVRGGCWCAFALSASSRFWKMEKEERRLFHLELALRGETSGILVYAGETPIGWCQFGPAAAFEHYNRNKAYIALDFPPAERADWRITCQFTDRAYRGRGVSVFALHAALAEIARRGGGIVEAFPFDIPGNTRPQYTGTIPMYTREGFHEVARLGTSTVLMRAQVAPAQ